MAAVQQDGIVFIDEIDKIVVNHETRYGVHLAKHCPLLFASISLPASGLPLDVIL